MKFYAGFNVWESDQDDEIKTGAISQIIEVQEIVETNAILSWTVYSAATISALLGSFIF